MSDTTDPLPSYGDVAAELLRQGQHGGPGLHVEIDPPPQPPQPAWVAAVDAVLEAGEAWALSRGKHTELVRQGDEYLADALDQLKAAWNS